jgi:hypothetical protein
MDIGEALAVLRSGGTVTRDGWNGTGMWVALSPGFELPADRIFSAPIQEAVGDGIGRFAPYLMMRTATGEFVPWLASQTDILAADWRTVQSPS